MRRFALFAILLALPAFAQAPGQHLDSQPIPPMATPSEQLRLAIPPKRSTGTAGWRSPNPERR